MLAKLESLIFFLAMMLAIVLEGGMVYWIVQHPVGPVTSSNLSGYWTGAALPQAWLFGALCMLASRLMGMFMASPADAVENERNRIAFLRLWCWTIVLIATQSFAFILDRVTGS